MRKQLNTFADEGLQGGETNLDRDLKFPVPLHHLIALLWALCASGEGEEMVFFCSVGHVAPSIESNRFIALYCNRFGNRKFYDSARPVTASIHPCVLLLPHEVRRFMRSF